MNRVLDGKMELEFLDLLEEHKGEMEFNTYIKALKYSLGSREFNLKRIDMFKEFEDSIKMTQGFSQGSISKSLQVNTIRDVILTANMFQQFINNGFVQYSGYLAGSKMQMISFSDKVEKLLSINNGKFQNDIKIIQITDPKLYIERNYNFSMTKSLPVSLRLDLKDGLGINNSLGFTYQDTWFVISESKFGKDYFSLVNHF